MPTFHYEALNQAGQPQKGEVDAPNSEEAIARIKGQGFFPTSVREKKVRKKTGAGGGGQAAAPQAKAKGKAKGKKKATEITIEIGGVSKKIITQFSRQLATLIDAGLPILRSIQILAEQQKPGQFKNILEQVAADVEGGSSLSEALGRHPKAFDRLYTKMIAAGEVGGVLDVILNRLSDFMEKAQALRRRITGAMIYPLAVIFFAVLILTGIMVFVIPKFQDIFANFGTELPLATKMLIGTADWVAGNTEGQVIPGWAVIIVSPFVLFLALKIGRRAKPVQNALDRFKLMIPIFGRLVKAGAIARFTRTLGTLIGAGVPILEAIAITRDTVGNAVYERALQRVHDSIREGESFAAPLRETRVVDLLVVNMIDVGEETGELDRMLTKVADNYDDEVDNLVRTLMSLLEPVLVIVLGVIVLVIVVALFLPLPTLIQGVMSN